MSVAKKKNLGPFLTELGKVGLYKKNQGRLARQLTAVGLLAVVAFGLYTLSGQLGARGLARTLSVGLPLGLFVISGWMVYRLVNYPRFADFLISVEAEMDKVTWSSRSELYRATVVVLVTMVFMGVLLFTYDQIWMWFFELIGFRV